MSTTSVASRADDRLSEAQLRAWRGMLFATAELRKRLADISQAAAELSEADYVVLLALVETDRRTLRSSELADAISWERSRVSHHVARLEKRGLIHRDSCPTDSRGAELRVSESGIAAVRKASGPHLRAVKRLFADALTDQQIEALGDIVDAMARHLETNEE
jgi:DNA-binding MarR family transcriptional regulator